MTSSKNWAPREDVIDIITSNKCLSCSRYIEPEDKHTVKWLVEGATDKGIKELYLALQEIMLNSVVGPALDIKLVEPEITNLERAGRFIKHHCLHCVVIGIERAATTNA